MSRIIFLIDVNNAFLSWTAVNLLKKGYKVDIRNICSVIGGDESKRHGIVLARSIPSKSKGIITGETLHMARKKCPNLKIYPPEYDLYQEMSNSLFTLLKEYTPDIEIFSIDECFIDYTKVKGLYGDEIEFAEMIKKQIKERLGFTVNVGIGNNKLCAKMASELKKPDMVHTIYDHEVKDKMWPLPINKLFGVGKKTEEILRKLKITTIEELANYDLDKLSKYFKNRALSLIESANGIDDSLVMTNKEEQKGISKSTTLEKDLKSKEEINKVLHKLADYLGQTIRKQNKHAYTISVNLRDRYFKSYSHQIKLRNATNITEEIYNTAKQLLDEMWHKEPIRLVGISLSDLVNKTSHQISLFEDIETRDKLNMLDKTMDELKEKYGSDIIKKASSVKNKRENDV
ncbi:MAG: DNA polymerase IV [Bacilli bacterium]|nr:DNA polymerase IV [Bacilli bacterium]